MKVDLFMRGPYDEGSIASGRRSAARWPRSCHQRRSFSRSCTRPLSDFERASSFVIAFSIGSSASGRITAIFATALARARSDLACAGFAL